MLFSSNRYGLRKLKLKKPTVFCLPGFHADPVGERTQAESIEDSMSLVRQYLLACRADPYYGVYLSEIDYLKPYLDMYPEERAGLMRLIQQERCAAGGAYNQPNETTISGESIIRNILVGSSYHKTILGYESPVYMAWDVFGHIPQLPQILEGCDFQAAVFTRTNYRDPSISIPGIPDLFLWYSPNGSSVLARRMNHVIPPGVGLLDYARQSLENMQKDIPSLNVELLLDTGERQTPRSSIIGHCRQLAQEEPELIVTGAAATKYFSCIHTLVANKKIRLEPVTRDMSQYNEGCELSRIDLKLANRLLENRLFEAELWGSIASFHGIAYPSKAIDHAWRQLLFCQQHHGITGWSTDIVYIDLLAIYRESLETVNRELQSTLEHLASSIAVPPEKSNESALLFNSLPWLRDGVVRHWVDIDNENESLELFDDAGEPLDYEIEQVEQNADGSPSRILTVWTEKNLPATGYTHRDFIKREGTDFPFLQETQSRTWMENEFFRIEVDPERGGGIVSILDKESDKEFVNIEHAMPANTIIQMIEGDGDDPACRLITTDEIYQGSNSTAEVQSLDGPVSSRLLIKGSGPGQCSLVQELRLYNGLPFIDCCTVLENYRGNDTQGYDQTTPPIRDFYAVAFPLDLPGSLPVLEERFYAKAYRRSKGNFDFHSSFTQWDSGHAMNSCYRWVDVSWSLLCRLMEGKEEHTNVAIGPSEIVTAQNRYQDVRLKLMMHLARHGITCSPRYDTDDIKKDRLFRSCSFSIGSSEDNAYTNNLLKQNMKARDYYERNMEEFGFATLVVNDNQYDTPHPVFIFAGKSEALTIQAVDDMIQSTIAHRWEYPHDSSFLGERDSVEDFGFAFLNKGNSLCSLEADGTLVVALMHSAPYPSPQTPWPFDFAEQKTHMFQYRLIPHRGDWRHAEIPRRAMEYNHEPIAISTTPHEGPLPSQASLLSVEPNNILISCLKPAGFPEAEYRSPRKTKVPHILRLYETHGEESNVWVESTRPVKSVKAVQINEQALPKKREVFREEQFIRTVAHANEILTLQLDIQGDKDTTHLIQPNTMQEMILAPARYWRHNSGSPPQGFAPVTLSLRGGIHLRYPNEKTTVHPMELVIVNNFPSEIVQGKVDIVTPPYWRAIPTRISYEIKGGSYQVVPIQLLLEEAGQDGFIKAQTTWEGMEITDILPIGNLPDLDIAMTLRRDSFNIKIHHDNPYPLSGSVSIITPIEAWPAEVVGEYSLTSFSPRQQLFSIESGKETVLKFPLYDPPNRFSIPSDNHWMIIKLETHHSLRYYHVRMDGRPSEGLGRMIYPPYKPLEIDWEMLEEE